MESDVETSTYIRYIRSQGINTPIIHLLLIEESMVALLAMISV